MSPLVDRKRQSEDIHRCQVGGTDMLRRTAKSSALLAGALFTTLLVVSAAASAQWLKHPDPRTPRTPDGKPNLTAPAPRTPDGKPDLGGLWNAVDGRYLTSLAFGGTEIQIGRASCRERVYVLV